MSTPSSPITAGPVAVVGIVTISGPNPKGYYRLKWLNPDGSPGGSPGDTTGGTDLGDARAKADEISHSHSHAAAPRPSRASTRSSRPTSPPAAARTGKRSLGSRPTSSSSTSWLRVAPPVLRPAGGAAHRCSGLLR